VFLPNRTNIDPSLVTDIRSFFEWSSRGASIEYSFQSEFSLFGPNSVAGAKPQMQVHLFPRT
jgi:hypothetical protein